MLLKIQAMQDIDFPKPKMHLFVCVNDRTGTQSDKPSCGPRIKPEDVKNVMNRREIFSPEDFLTPPIVT